MTLPDVSLGELYSLLGEKDVRIYQLEKQARSFETAQKAVKEKDPFKKDK